MVDPAFLFHLSNKWKYFPNLQQPLFDVLVASLCQNYMVRSQRIRRNHNRSALFFHPDMECSFLISSIQNEQERAPVRFLHRNYRQILFYRRQCNHFIAPVDLRHDGVDGSVDTVLNQLFLFGIVTECRSAAFRIFFPSPMAGAALLIQQKIPVAKSCRAVTQGLNIFSRVNNQADCVDFRFRNGFLRIVEISVKSDNRVCNLRCRYVRVSVIIVIYLLSVPV